jgi:hypothetical protein
LAIDITKLLKNLSQEEKAVYIERLEQNPFLAYQPHPIQRKFHKSQARIRWFLGGNRSGKTRALVQEVLWYATGLHPWKEIKTPNEVWVSSLDYPSSRDVVQPMIKALIGIRYYRNWREADHILELSNGSIIGFKSNDAGWEKYQGTKKRLIALDEEHNWEVYQECVARITGIVGEKGGDIICAMTPLHGMTWVYDEIWEPWMEETKKDIDCFISATKDNPYIPREEIKRLGDAYFDQEREARLEGKFVEFAGLIYRDFNRDAHIIKPFTIPKHWTRYRCIDPGIHNPTACMWWAVNPDGEHYIYDEYYQADKTIQENATAIKSQTGGDYIHITLIDPRACNRNPAHPELRTTRDEYAQFGIYCKPAPAGPDTVTPGINKVKQLIGINDKTKRPKLRIFDTCLMTIREITRYRWDTYRLRDAGEKNPKEKPKKVSDHLMDCMRYIAMVDPYYIDPFYNEDMDTIPPRRKYTKYG